MGDECLDLQAERLVFGPVCVFVQVSVLFVKKIHKFRLQVWNLTNKIEKNTSILALSRENQHPTWKMNIMKIGENAQIRKMYDNFR